MAYEVFEQSKFINIQMMQYAMELIEKEERKANKIKEKEEKENEKGRNGNGISGLVVGKGMHLAVNLGLFALMLVVWLYFRDDVFKYILNYRK